jgi:uncharacterized protein YdaU (DUF1376 family)
VSEKSLAMMPWFPRDFIAATRHLALAERGAYRELLDHQWELGRLPSDETRLARILGVTVDEFRPIWISICDKFVLIDGNLLNKRLEDHRKESIERRDRKVDGANKTNAKRAAERIAKRDDIGTPPSPSPSPSKDLRKDKLAEARLTMGLNLEAFDAWITYRADRKPAIKPGSLVACAAELAAFGTHQASVVQHSIANGYQGLFAPKINGHQQPEPTRSRAFPS